MNYKFTIFTPCYNAARTIGRVFLSLAKQTYVNYEWIIINDGSTDDSDRVILELIEHFPYKAKITYLTQRNMGKHRAWNKAAEIADSDLFLCADADDEFVADALEFYNQKANEISLVGSDCYCGINTCAFEHATGEVVGTEFPEDGLICDNFEMVYKYHIRGDKWMCNRTEFIKRYRFPDVSAPFFPETRLWYAFALNGYKLACYNKYTLSHYIEPTSLCNSIWFKLNKRAAIAKMRYHFWLLWNAYPRIIALNRKDAVYLLAIVTLKNAAMFVGGIFFDFLRHYRRK